MRCASLRAVGAMAAGLLAADAGAAVLCQNHKTGVVAVRESACKKKEVPVDLTALGLGGLADGAVTTGKLADGAVTAAKVGDGQVGGTKLATGAVGAAAIADGAVGSAALADASVAAAKLAAGGVGTAALAPGAVTAAKLAVGAVGNGALVDGAVSAAKIGDGAARGEDRRREVGTSELANAAVSPEKLGVIPAVRATSPSETFNNDQVLDPGSEPVVFDEELYDTANMHASGVPGDGSGSRFVAPIAGVYVISAGLIFSDTVNPADRGTGRQLYLQRNGSTSTLDLIAAQQVPPRAGATIVNVTAAAVLQAGDYVELYANHDAATSLSTPQAQFGLFGDGRHFFSMTWIGPAQ